MHLKVTDEENRVYQAFEFWGKKRIRWGKTWGRFLRVSRGSKVERGWKNLTRIGQIRICEEKSSRRKTGTTSFLRGITPSWKEKQAVKSCGREEWVRERGKSKRESGGRAFSEKS